MQESQNKSKFGRQKYRSKNNLRTYFAEYSEEEIQSVIEKLSDYELDILHKKYGADILNSVQNGNLTKEEHSKLNYIIEKMKRILKSNLNKSTETTDDVSNKQEVSNQNSVLEETKTDLEVSLKPNKENNTNTESLLKPKQENNTISEKEYVKVLEIFNNQEFIEMTKEKPILDCVILSLKFGYIDGKYFSTSAIANFLDMDQNKVSEIIKNGLVSYKEKINEIILGLVENETDKSNEEQSKLVKIKNDSTN